MAEFIAELDDAQQPQSCVHFTGSHDPAVEVLAAALGQADTPLRLDTVFCGSVEGLIRLQERQSELAGFYVSPVRTAGSVAHVTLRKWLRPAAVRLLRLAWREQGLIVAPEVARRPITWRCARMTRPRAGWRRCWRCLPIPPLPGASRHCPVTPWPSRLAS